MYHPTRRTIGIDPVVRAARPDLQSSALRQHGVHVTLVAKEIPVVTMAIARVATDEVTDVPGGGRGDEGAARDVQVRERH